MEEAAFEFVEENKKLREEIRVLLDDREVLSMKYL